MNQQHSPSSSRDQSFGLKGHDISRRANDRRQLLLLTAGVWLASFLLPTFRDLADPPSALPLMTLVRLCFALLGALMCWPLHLLISQMNSRAFHAQILALLPAITACALIYTQLTLWAQDWAATGQTSSNSGRQFYNTVYWSLFFLAWAALSLALAYSRESADQAQRARISEQLAHDAQLRALRYQVDPHFLFNTLNSVSALVVTGRPDQAEIMLAKLSRYFRASVALDPQNAITLADEVGLQRTYLEIEQVRFPDLDVHVSLDPQVAGQRVPPLILQPLVENAIKFGVAAFDSPAIVLLSCSLRGNMIVIEVENDVARDRPAEGIGTGTGLHNVEARLHEFFGEGASLKTSSPQAGRYRVELIIPLSSAS